MTIVPTTAPILEVDGLSVEVATAQGWTSVVNDVHLSVKPGEIHGIVGESGSGKTLTSLAIMGLLPPSARTKAGRVVLNEVDLVALRPRQLAERQGRDLAMIFQEPMTSLNPVFTVGDQIAESYRYHRGVGRKVAMRRAAELLDSVGIPDARRRVHEYPHAFSGGMRQRVMIAMALACDPQLLIADEPSTALDVTMQAAIVQILRDLADGLDMAMLFISHDLGLVSGLCDAITVMYAGETVEQGSVTDVLRQPLHPYTDGLIESNRSIDVPGPLFWIPGSPPRPGAFPEGCRFHTRCPRMTERCTTDGIAMVTRDGGHPVRCIHELTTTGGGVV